MKQQHIFFGLFKNACSRNCESLSRAAVAEVGSTANHETGRKLKDGAYERDWSGDTNEASDGTFVRKSHVHVEKYHLFFEGKFSLSKVLGGRALRL